MNRCYDLDESLWIESCIRLEKGQSDVDDFQSVDYRQLTPFVEVIEGQQLFTVRQKELFPLPETLGQQLIYIQPEFSIDDSLIADDSEEGVCVYRARHSGMFCMNEKCLKIKNPFEYRGNINLHTGDLRYSGSIRIVGNIEDGSSIICGGDLEIHGVIENNVSIDCKGNLLVRGGINGKSTVILCSGTMHADYIQGSRVRAGREVTITNHAFQSKIHSKRVTSVNGKSIGKGTRGAVVGGTINGELGVHIHSAGVETSITHLAAGVDIELLEALLQAGVHSSALKREVTRKLGSLGFDPRTPGILELLQRRTGERRKGLRDRLIEIRDSLRLLLQIKQELPKKRERVYFHKNDAFISVDQHITPDVQIQIGSNRMTLREAVNRKITYMLGSEGIEEKSEGF